MTALRHFLLALQFFTRIPVTGRLAVWVGFSPAMLRASAAYFPAVGVSDCPQLHVYEIISVKSRHPGPSHSRSKTQFHTVVAWYLGSHR